MKSQLFTTLIILLTATQFSHAQSCPNCTTGNCQNGQGTCVWEGRSTYIGDWQNGNKHGQGKETWKDGSSYEGEFVNGKFEGQGTYLGKIGDGNKYEGQWKDGKRNGQGTLYKADGTSQTGCWNGAQFNPCDTRVLPEPLPVPPVPISSITWLEPAISPITTPTQQFTLKVCLPQPAKQVQVYLNGKPLTSGARGFGVKPREEGCQYPGEKQIKLPQAGESVMVKIVATLDGGRTVASEEREIIWQPQNSVPTSAPVSPSAVAQPSEKRVALIIGNDKYKDAPLRNPVNDANDLAKELKKLGFEVILKTNATREEMGQAISEFGEKLADGGVALFYYSGHGLQYENLNYLVPIDAKLEKEADVRFATVEANYVLEQMEQVHSGVNIIVLDACRNAPFGRGFSRGANKTKGLAKMDAPTGSLIVYATQPGNTADDGKGRNGTYTAQLLAVLREKPYLKFLEFFNEVGLRVANDTQQVQVPWQSSSPLSKQSCFGHPCQN